jgi:uncharacterized protein
VSLSTEANKRTARLVVEQLAAGRVDPALMTDEFIHWTAMSGELGGDALNAVMARLVAQFTSPFLIHVDGVIAEDDRVALEAHSEGELRSGERYRNHYHFLFEFAPDGRLRRMNEHMDSRHVVEVIRPLLTAAA